MEFVMRAIRVLETRDEGVGAFVESNRDWIFRLALRIVGSHDAAEDVAQEALLRAAKNRHKLRQEDSEQAWLRRITVRRALSHLRDQEFYGPPSEVRLTADVTQEVAVRHALARLKPEQQAILALAFGERLSYEEISEALAIPIGTVASRVHSAKAAFKKLWEDRP